MCVCVSLLFGGHLVEDLFFRLVSFSPSQQFINTVGTGLPGLAITKQGLVCLTQGYDAETTVRLKPFNFSISRQALYH